MGLLAVIIRFRFNLDFLRASDLGFVDRRYLGLTPGAVHRRRYLRARGVVDESSARPDTLTPKGVSRRSRRLAEKSGA